MRLRSSEIFITVRKPVCGCASQRTGRERAPPQAGMLILAVPVPALGFCEGRLLSPSIYAFY